MFCYLLVTMTYTIMLVVVFSVCRPDPMVSRCSINGMVVHIGDHSFLRGMAHSGRLCLLSQVGAPRRLELLMLLQSPQVPE